MALRPTSYVPHRWAIYSLLWCAAVVELALTAFRIHHTRSLFGFHEAIVAELLVVSILTILWIPVTLLFHRSAGGSGTGAGSALSPRHGETGGNLILWIMWLVGAAIVTVCHLSYSSFPSVWGALHCLHWLSFLLYSINGQLGASQRLQARETLSPHLSHLPGFLLVSWPLLKYLVLRNIQPSAPGMLVDTVVVLTQTDMVLAINRALQEAHLVLLVPLVLLVRVLLSDFTHVFQYITLSS